MWLLITDAHSKWLDVFKASSPSALVTVEKCRQCFATYGVPESVVTDNAACFTCPEFESFCQRNGIRHITSPPWSPKSNGLVERAVQTFKMGLKKQRHGSLDTKVARFLFNYRSTPHTVTGVSPAELLFNRPMRTHLDLLKESPRRGQVERYQWDQKKRYDVHARPRSFKVGDGVFVSAVSRPGGGPRWLPGLVTACHGMACVVKLQDGRSFRRHIDHIRLRNMDIAESTDPADVPGQQGEAQQGGSMAAAVSALPSLLSPHLGLPPSSSVVAPAVSSSAWEAPPGPASTPPLGSPIRAEPPPLSSSEHQVERFPEMPVTPMPVTTPLRRSTRISRQPDRYGY